MPEFVTGAAIFGCLFYILLSAQYTLVLKGRGALLIPAFLFSAVWSLASFRITALDYFHAAIWGGTLLVIVGTDLSHSLRSIRLWLWGLPIAGVIVGAYTVQAEQPPILLAYFYILLCVGILLLVEQFIRNGRGLYKLVAIGVGALFLYNLFVYAVLLISQQPDNTNLQARTLANTLLAVALFAAPLTMNGNASNQRQLGLSRPMVFTTTSLFIGGSVLLLVALLGYIVNLGGGVVGAIIQPLLLFMAILSMGLWLASSARRARIRVWIDKNFFQTKYDYNKEWSNLSERLSTLSNSEDYARVAIEVLLPIYNARAGVFYLGRGRQYLPFEKIGVEAELDTLSLDDRKEFLQRLQSEWIFIREAGDDKLSRYNELIPPQLTRLGGAQVIVPLTSQDRLLGFIVIVGEASQFIELDWEDLDLLRMMGKQISNFVGLHMLSNEMVVTRQFEAYHQLTTFIMHDLKNLIAQQALVVQNASRFINNPEFVSDAITTIENSVKKMNRLVLKINQNSAINLDAPDHQSVDLQEALQTAMVKCSTAKPVPTFHPAETSLKVLADFDSLTLAFSHLISNAQEACGKSGKVDIYLYRQGDYCVCEISDTGAGMDEEFIQQKLFKPFVTTKKTYGMGIGAYQSQQIVSRIGGDISVESGLGRGTCFTIKLPLRSENE